MKIPTQAEIAGQLVDEIMAYIESETAERDLIESSVNVHFSRLVDSTHKRLQRVADDQRAKLNAVVEPYDAD